MTKGKITEANLKELLTKHMVSGPYYTSYPTGKVWTEEFAYQQYKEALKRVAIADHPISLYVHFPFCTRRCHFCFCYTSITHSREKIKKFLHSLAKEIEILFEFLKQFNKNIEVREIHLGGGSPSFLSIEEFTFLIDSLSPFVDKKRLAEFTIEIDVITVTEEKLWLYLSNGVNRISFGIQDFNPKVQEAIGRIQSPKLIGTLLLTKVRSNFKSVNFDLMYGLPFQTRTSIKETAEISASFKPDRIAVYNYCHLPEMNPNQKAINREDLPEEMEKFFLFKEASDFLLVNGYDTIGIDHFARKSDELSLANAKKKLCRHFMGYTPGRTPHIIGLGPSSLGGFSDYYFQNLYSMQDYESVVEKGKFPVFRGYQLNFDDKVRREVINRLLCYFCIDRLSIEKKFGITFEVYFKKEIANLKVFETDGIIRILKTKIVVVPGCEAFVRLICSVFDVYLAKHQDSQPYKPAIQRSGSDESP